MSARGPLWGSASVISTSLVWTEWSRDPGYLYPGDDDIQSIGGEHKIFVNLSFFFRSAGDRFVPRKARKAKR
jgi:hypothetical protein